MASESVKFDRVADIYDATRGLPEGEIIPTRDLILEAAGLNEESRVLEVGVGTGRIAVPLAEAVGAMFGIDLSRPMLGKLREKSSTKSVHVVEGDATVLPYPDNSFDAVLAVHVFHLIPPWQQGIAEVRRVLRPDGRFALAGGGGNEIRAQMMQWLEVKQDDHVRGIGHLQLFDYLKANGWAQLGEHAHHFKMFQVPSDYLAHVRGRYWSGSWRWTDEEHARYIEIVERKLPEEFEDPAAPVPVESSFHVQVFVPAEDA